MTRQKELTSLIERGLQTERVAESEGCFFEDVFGKFYVCALGAGLVGEYGSATTAYESVEAEKEVHLQMSGKDLVISPGYVDVAANLLDIDFALAEAIDKAPLLGVPAMAIIKRLKQGTFPY